MNDDTSLITLTMDIDIITLFLLFFISLFILLLIMDFYFGKETKSISGRHVVITGGSSGIGCAIAKECALKGAHVTLIARNESVLQKTVKILEEKKIHPDQKFSYRSLDISQSYEQVEKVFKEIENSIEPIYMLVNCAGLAICGLYEELSVADTKKLMDTNYYGTFYCIRYVLPRMKAAGDGIIVITASMVALFGIYGYGPYSATKFALRGMAETIAMEAKHQGVTVTLALPNDTDTPGLAEENKSKPEATKIISSGGGLAKPRDVAKKIISDALRGSFFSTLGLESWMLSTLCCGMIPSQGFVSTAIQAFILGPLRVIGVIIQWNFDRIVAKCAKKTKTQ